MKVSESKYIFLILYVDDILLATNDLGMMFETKKFLSTQFEMKDMGEAAYVIGIEIFRDRTREILGLSQNGYIERILESFGMQNCSPQDAPIQKGDKFSLMQCPQNELERKHMEEIPYASAVGSLMYAQTCTRPDISFAVGMLGRYQSNPGFYHWKAAKKVIRYLQGTKDFMLTYRRSENLKVIGYSDSDLVDALTTGSLLLATCSLWLIEQFLGKVPNRLSLQHPLWKQNLWCVMRPLFKECGYENLSQAWDFRQHC